MLGGARLSTMTNKNADIEHLGISLPPDPESTLVNEKSEELAEKEEEAAKERNGEEELEQLQFPTNESLSNDGDTEFEKYLKANNIVDTPARKSKMPV